LPRSKNETFEYFELLRYKNPTIYRTIKRFEKQKNEDIKIGSGQKFAPLPSKSCATLKKQTAGCSAKSYRKLGQKIQIHHNTIKKYSKKMKIHRKATPETTASQ
jgi:hypothetical protein